MAKVSGKWRVWIAVVLAVLVIVVVLQNTETVQTRLLFFTISMPRAALLFVTLLAGFVIGLASASRLERAKDDERAS